MSKQEYGEGCVVRVPRCSPRSNTKDSRRLFPYRYATEVVLARLSVCCNSWRSRCVECVLIRITIRRRVIKAEGLDRTQPGKKKRLSEYPVVKPALNTHMSSVVSFHIYGNGDTHLGGLRVKTEQPENNSLPLERPHAFWCKLCQELLTLQQQKKNGIRISFRFQLVWCDKLVKTERTPEGVRRIDVIVWQDILLKFATKRTQIVFLLPCLW